MRGPVPPTAMIETSGLTKRYRSVVALDSVDLELPGPGITGLLGPDGGGKSTLLKILLGAVRPTDGTARVLRWDVRRHPVDTRRHVGYVPEEKTLYREVPVEAYIRYYAGFFGDASAEDGLRLLRRWSVPTGRRPGEMSEGDRAKVLLAAVLCRDPRIFLLDGLFRGLDPASAAEVAGLLRERRARGSGILVATDRVEEAERVCDRVVILAGGRVRLAGKVEDLRRRWKRVRIEDPEAAAGLEDHPTVVRLVRSGDGVEVVASFYSAKLAAEITRRCGGDPGRTRGLSLREIYLEVMAHGG